MKTKYATRAFWRSMLTSGVSLLILSSAALSAEEPKVPVVDGQIGQCSADFTVKDSEDKPIYDAKIAVMIRHGFLGLHKTELQVGTNSDGKARVAGLPERVKRTLKFEITSGGNSKTISVDTSEKCDSTFEVILGVQ